MSNSKVAGTPETNSSSNNNTNDNGQPDDAADVKIILLGDSAVGKSKLVERFLMGPEYLPHQISTYALTVYRHMAKDEHENPVSVDFWDTAGQERFASMHPTYYYRAHACILVFDVTRKVSYQNLNQWYKELQQYRPGIPCLVVANKIDVDYNVTNKKFNFATKRKLPFQFCSAADGTNVVQMFRDTIKMACEYKNAPTDDFMEEVMRELDYFDNKDQQQQKQTEQPQQAQ